MWWLDQVLIMLNSYVVPCTTCYGRVQTLLMMMAFNAPTDDKAKANFDLLCDV
jgi:hypothetical protein